MKRIFAIILRELITTVPIFVGMGLVVGAFGSFNTKAISIMVPIVEITVGAIAMAVGFKNFNYFYN